jgi:transcriptional regulator with XRE-family HTH domain
MDVESLKAFSVRLRQSIENMKGVVPDYREGRNTVIARKLGNAPETIRKWLNGEAMPRPRMMALLAKYLDVDAGWLWGGGETPPSKKDTRLHVGKMPGIVHFAAGMAMIEGASCAPPDMQDPRKEFVDFIMIKDGVQAAIRTSLGREIRPDTYEFVVPSAFEQVHNVGFVWHNPSKVHLLDLKGELITAHKTAKGSDKAVLVMYKNGKYITGRDEWPRINSIGEVL